MYGSSNGVVQTRPSPENRTTLAEVVGGLAASELRAAIEVLTTFARRSSDWGIVYEARQPRDPDQATALRARLAIMEAEALRARKQGGKLRTELVPVWAWQ